MKLDQKDGHILVTMHTEQSALHKGTYDRGLSTSVVCKQLEHVIAGYLRQVWDKNNWLYEGQHGFRPGYSCESQVIMVCQDIVNSLDEGVGIDALIIDFPKAFNLVPHE